MTLFTVAPSCSNRTGRAVSTIGNSARGAGGPHTAAPRALLRIVRDITTTPDATNDRPTLRSRLRPAHTPAAHQTIRPPHFHGGGQAADPECAPTVVVAVGDVPGSAAAPVQHIGTT